MTRGIDYAFSPHPSASAIKSAGHAFVCRYMSSLSVNDTNGKNLLRAELGSLLAAGLEVVVVEESTAGRMKSGRSAGVTDAQHAKAVTAALGMSNVPVYFACDFDATPGDQTEINAYLDGAASVIGHNRTGIYGGYYPVKRALDAGKAAYAWQTSAWSGGQWDSRAHIRQQGTVRVGGVTVDLDEAMKDDFGQWPRPRSSAPKPAAPSPDQWSFPAPTGLRRGTNVTFPVYWNEVPPHGSVKPSNYTIQAIQMNGKVAVEKDVSGGAADLTLVKGWTYKIRVWAGGGPVGPPHAEITITA